MAIIVDPDNLDRQQIIYNTPSQLISFYPVGALRAAGTTGSDGATSATTTFTSAGSTFQTDSVAVGDILCIFTGADAGHYRIASIPTETTVTVDTFTGFTAFGTDTGIAFDIRQATGGTAADGATEQAIYSFSKEEWRADSFTATTGDDLIRHEFPFETITSEQFELGGGAAHADWGWFDGPIDTDRTINYVKTGGWAEKNTAGLTLAEYTGIVTLGNLDADAQVYYQQVSTTTTPTDFVLTGPVNQAIQTLRDDDGDQIFAEGSDFDRRSYLKLFVRKKARTYAQSEIADIGVTTIQTIVNRFPLSHAVDAAITSSDAAIVGSAPYRNSFQVSVGGAATDGVKSATPREFTSATAVWQTSGVAAGDALRITAGGDSSDFGYYTIASVDSETNITLAADADFTDWVTEEGSITFEVYSYYRVSTITGSAHTATVSAGASNGIVDVDTATGTFTDTTGGDFVNDGVIAGDWLWITNSAGNNGMYKVVSRDSATVLTVNTSDQPFPGVLEAGVSYFVLTSGMYLQYKKDAVTNAAPTSYAFDDTNAGFGNRPTITRSDGAWDTGIVAGTLLEITSATNTSNNGSYTVFARESATVLSLIATETIVDDATDTAAVIAVYDTFKRAIAGTTYAFEWRVDAANASLQSVYQFVQHQLRQSTDIDFGDATFRGDITDLLMSFSTPTGTTFNMYIDNILAADTNNVTYTDATDNARLEAFVAAGSIAFNTNLQNDASAKYWMFFKTNPGGNYSTENAIIVNDEGGTPITGNVSAQTSVSFTFDYDGNVQGGRTPAADADVVVVAIGLNTAQFVLAEGTIGRNKANNFSLVAALERNYSNPA